VKDAWKKTRYFFYKRVLHADDTPHRIALGAGVAMLVAFSPTVGFQTVIAIALATLLRANKVVCIPIVWITNPLTILPIYGACWDLGRTLMIAPAAGNGSNFAAKLADLARHADQDVLAAPVRGRVLVPPASADVRVRRRVVGGVPGGRGGGRLSHLLHHALDSNRVPPTASRPQDIPQHPAGAHAEGEEQVPTPRRYRARPRLPRGHLNKPHGASKDSHTGMRKDSRANIRNETARQASCRPV